MPKLNKPKFLMIHHSAVSQATNKDQLRAINNYHQAKWQFKSSLGSYVGYNYLINPAGRAHHCRADGERTAAAYQQGMNDGRCIHICLEGNFEVEKTTPNQIYKLRDLLRSLTKEHNISKDNILFHRDLSPTACPGANVDKVFVKSLVAPEIVKEVEKEQPKRTKEDVIKDIINLLDELEVI